GMVVRVHVPVVPNGEPAPGCTRPRPCPPRPAGAPGRSDVSSDIPRGRRAEDVPCSSAGSERVNESVTASSERVFERRLRRRNPAVGGRLGGGVAPFEDRAPAPPAQPVLSGMLEGGRRGPLRLTRAPAAP